MRAEDLEQLKRQLPLLDYLQQHRWRGRRVGGQQEFVGPCPLHREQHPSFYVSARKNLFYCHGCGRGGDLIRFVQLWWNLPFPDAVLYLQQQLPQAAFPAASALLDQTMAFYQSQLHHHADALAYLAQRGLRDPVLIQQLRIGYAPGGTLRRHLTTLGHGVDRLLQLGLINHLGRDSFYRRVVFPCRNASGLCVNLYGRSLGTAVPHRFLPGSRGGLFAWETVSAFSQVILVEGLFDLAVLWQAGFRNTTCAFGTRLSSAQLAQLCDRDDRRIDIAFDQDANHAGQQAAHTLAQRILEAGRNARIVMLPAGRDPNSYFLSGATADDFARCLDQAQSLPS